MKVKRSKMMHTGKSQPKSIKDVSRLTNLLSELLLRKCILLSKFFQFDFQPEIKELKTL